MPHYCSVTARMYPQNKYFLVCNVSYFQQRFRSSNLDDFVPKVLIFHFYFQASSGILNEITLEEKLRSELPCYMLPKLIKVPVIPALVNGKVDRQALLQRY